MLFKWSKTICRNNDLVNNQVFSEELAKNWQRTGSFCGWIFLGKTPYAYISKWSL
jgi:hypothetical protein